MIRIALIDDHLLFRQGLLALLEENKDVVIAAEYDDPVIFLEKLPFLEVDLILMDVDMPKMSGINAAKQAKKKKPELKIIMLSIHDNFSTVKSTIEAGVDGYLLKTSDREEVNRAIQLVIDGKDYFTEKVNKVLLGSFRAPESIGLIELSPREKEILALVCQELTTQEIADQLFISIHTVETHRRSLLHKTGCRNIAGLVKFALKNKLH